MERILPGSENGLNTAQEQRNKTTQDIIPKTLFTSSVISDRCDSSN